MGLILFIVILLGFGNQPLWEKLNEIDTNVREIDTNVRMGFSSLHDFDRNRVATMRSVVRGISFSEVSLNCSQGVAGQNGIIAKSSFSCTIISFA
jgi:hypothetical protein